MDASELRLGSLILAKCNEAHFEGIDPFHIVVVTSINDEEIGHDALGFLHPTWETNIKNCKPIPVSEEWLLRLGFSKAESKFWDKPELLTIQISNNETLDFEDNEFFIANIGSHNVFSFEWNQPKYVHQLQNLFYTITGEELELKQQTEVSNG